MTLRESFVSIPDRGSPVTHEDMGKFFELLNKQIEHLTALRNGLELETFRLIASQVPVNATHEVLLKNCNGIIDSIIPLQLTAQSHITLIDGDSFLLVPLAFAATQPPVSNLGIKFYNGLKATVCDQPFLITGRMLK